MPIFYWYIFLIDWLIEEQVGHELKAMALHIMEKFNYSILIFSLKVLCHLLSFWDSRLQQVIWVLFINQSLTTV